MAQPRRTMWLSLLRRLCLGAHDGAHARIEIGPTLLARLDALLDAEVRLDVVGQLVGYHRADRAQAIAQPLAQSVADRLGDDLLRGVTREAPALLVEHARDLEIEEASVFRPSRPLATMLVMLVMLVMAVGL